jgi:hypothetical protein
MELGDSAGPETPAAPYVQRPAPAQLAETLPPVRSRWQKGTLTFGPVGRLAWTFVASAPLLWLIKNFVTNGILPGDPTILMGQLFGGVFVVTWTGWIWHRILRDVWAKEVVYVPQPIVPATQAMTDDQGRHLVTLAEYVAGQAEASAPHLP